MELFLYMLPNKSRKSEEKWQKDYLEQPKEVKIGDYLIWLFKLPQTKEEIDTIQESFWKRRLFLNWVSKSFKRMGKKQIGNQVKKAFLEKRFEEYYITDKRVRVLYALYYLMEEFEWKKETKWFILCGNLLDGSRLLDFVSYFLMEANCVFLYNSSIADFELDGLWEESGLLLSKTRTLEELAECDLVLDANSDYRIPKKYLPKKMTYVDLTEDMEKRRYLLAKCGNIQYISLSNYLDRVFRSTV